MAFRNLEKFLHLRQQSRFLGRPEGSLFVLRAIRLLKTSLKKLRPSRFFQFPECRNSGRMAFRHLETYFIDMNKIDFKTFRRQIMSSLDHSPT
jgi:hypothetical protein